MSASRPASSTPLAPSLHSSSRSPGWSSITNRSGSRSWVPSMARRMRLRCGCTRASASVIRPSSISVWTNVWSLVSWLISPSRKRYARLSPTWPIPTRWPSKSAIVAVVLVPLIDGSSSTSSAILSCARCIALLTRPSRSLSSMPSGSGASSSLRSSPIAVLLAMSPRAAPPTPSHTATRCGPTYPESWLSLRTRPTSEIAEKTSRTVVTANDRPDGAHPGHAPPAALPVLAGRASRASHRRLARRAPGARAAVDRPLAVTTAISSAR